MILKLIICGIAAFVVGVLFTSLVTVNRVNEMQRELLCNKQNNESIIKAKDEEIRAQDVVIQMLKNKTEINGGNSNEEG